MKLIKLMKKNELKTNNLIFELLELKRNLNFIKTELYFIY